MRNDRCRGFGAFLLIKKLGRDIWLYAPAEQRLGQPLYMGLCLQKLFPTAMALPSKKISFGLPPTAIKRIYIKSKLIAIKAKLNQRFPRLRLTRDIRANYLDYTAMFRKREDYKEILNKAFTVLEKENFFIC